MPHTLKAMALTLLLAPSLAQAQMGMPGLDGLVKAGGEGDALAESCGSHTRDDLNDRKRQQKEMAIPMGVSESQFNAWFAEGRKTMQGKLGVMSDTQRQQACQQLQQAEAGIR